MPSNTSWTANVDTTATPNATSVPLRARVTDSDGKQITTQITVRVQNVQPVISPTITITSPSGTSPTVVGTINVIGTATKDPARSINGVTVKLGNQSPVNATSSDGFANWTCSINTTGTTNNSPGTTTPLVATVSDSSQPPLTGTFTRQVFVNNPITPTQDIWVALVGDMCDGGTQDSAPAGSGSGKTSFAATSDLIVNETRVVAAIQCGDLAYGSGTVGEFQSLYNPTYGRFIDIAWPINGNHEASDNPANNGYDWYWSGKQVSGQQTRPDRGFHQPGDINKRWWAKDLPNGWRVYSLDSNVASNTEQQNWLQNDLANNSTGKHVIAQWHHPQWAAKGNGPATGAGTAALYQILYNARVDILLVGHAHYYERYHRLNPSQQTDDTRGVKEYLIGSGGHSLGLTSTSNSSSEKFLARYGVGFFLLKQTEFYFEFRWTNGTVLDSGTIPVLNRSL